MHISQNYFFLLFCSWDSALSSASYATRQQWRSMIYRDKWEYIEHLWGRGGAESQVPVASVVWLSSVYYVSLYFYLELSQSELCWYSVGARKQFQKYKWLINAHVSSELWILQYQPAGKSNFSWTLSCNAQYTNGLLILWIYRAIRRLCKHWLVPVSQSQTQLDHYW